MNSGAVRVRILIRQLNSPIPIKASRQRRSASASSDRANSPGVAFGIVEPLAFFRSTPRKKYAEVALGHRTMRAEPLQCTIDVSLRLTPPRRAARQRLRALFTPEQLISFTETGRRSPHEYLFVRSRTIDVSITVTTTRTQKVVTSETAVSKWVNLY